MTATFEQAFIQEHANEVTRYRRLANRAMVQYVIVRLGLVIGSATLPALTTLEDRAWSVGLAVMVAIFAGLDTQFQWGQEWQHFRSAENGAGTGQEGIHEAAGQIEQGARRGGSGRPREQEF